MKTHNVTRLDTRPRIKRPILIIPLHKHLSHDLNPRIHASRLDIRKNRRAIHARLDGCACAIWTRSDAEFRADGDFVGGKGSNGGVGAEDENGVVDVEAY